MSQPPCRVAGLALAWLAAVSCGGEASPPVTELRSPAEAGGLWPDLRTRDGRLYMSWTRVVDETGEVLFAVHEAGEWSDAETIARDDALFVNWADFPRLAVADDGSLAAHWLVRNGKHPYAYGIRFAERSPDGVWGDPIRPHVDDGDAEHGFVSLVPEADGALGVVWLDGRDMEADGGAMRLIYRRWSAEVPGPEVVLDPDVCTCCQTSAAWAGPDLVVAYRDHTAGEIRDISVVRRTREGWSAPRTVHTDGWEIAGCPVNGPAVDARGERVGLAWFTAADETPRVLLALSDDGGSRFADPLRIDDGDPIGRVDIKRSVRGGWVVTWMESVAGGAEIRLGLYDEAGAPLEVRAVGTTRAGRNSGFPRLALRETSAFVAWTDPGPPSSVRVVRLDL